jgi:hypothetical protein
VSHRRNKEIKGLPELNEMKTQPIRTYGMAVLRGKFIAMSAYIKNRESSQINNLMLHLKLLEKQEQAKPQKTPRYFSKVAGYKINYKNL